jgi:hypothetical protein
MSWHDDCAANASERCAALRARADAAEFHSGFVTAQRDVAETALKGISGALVDAGDVIVPDDEARYEAAIRDLTAKRDALERELNEAAAILAGHMDAPPSESFSYRSDKQAEWRAILKARAATLATCKDRLQVPTPAKGEKP